VHAPTPGKVSICSSLPGLPHPSRPVFVPLLAMVHLHPPLLCAPLVPRPPAGGPAIGDIRSRCLRLSDGSSAESLAVKRLLGHRLPLEPRLAKAEWCARRPLCQCLLGPLAPPRSGAAAPTVGGRGGQAGPEWPRASKSRRHGSVKVWGCQSMTRAHPFPSGYTRVLLRAG